MLEMKIFTNLKEKFQDNKKIILTVRHFFSHTLFHCLCGNFRHIFVHRFSGGHIMLHLQSLRLAQFIQVHCSGIFAETSRRTSSVNFLFNFYNKPKLKKNCLRKLTPLYWSQKSGLVYLSHFSLLPISMHWLIQLRFQVFYLVKRLKFLNYSFYNNFPCSLYFTIKFFLYRVW